MINRSEVIALRNKQINESTTSAEFSTGGGVGRHTTYHSELTYYHYNRFTAVWILSGTTQVSRYQKGKTKTNLDFLEQDAVMAVGSAGQYANLHVAPDR